MSALKTAWKLVVLSLSLALFLWVFLPQDSFAANIINYKDRISDSGPSEQANHTLSFVVTTDISPGGQIEVTPPAGFTIMATSSFGIRNVELYVNNVPRIASTTAAAGIDQVDITAGSPGFIRYTLAPDGGLSSGDLLELRIGNHTSGAILPIETFSTSTGTTTIPGDIEPVINSPVLGLHEVQVEIFDGGLVADAAFVIFLNEKVIVPSVDTTEEVPPFRFNGSPTSTVGGTTLNVEISLETDELADCRYDIVPGTPFGSQPFVFANTGLIFHSTVVAVTPNTTESFYVRCIDDEDNFNIDDYLIQFVVDPAPSGSSTSDGSTDGDGTGTGNEGTGDGDGSGGSTGESDGGENTEGDDSGGGGSGGGGGGGGRGDDDDDTAGGGFEEDDDAFPSGDGRVIINGFAFPNSDVAVLVDGNVAEVVQANSSGQYSATLDEIARGVYTFGVYAAGPDDVLSSTFSTSFTVTGARTSVLSNINISPSISVDPDPVDVGDEVEFSGYGLPDATIEIQYGRINSSNSSQLSVQTGSNGRWVTTANTTGLTRDTYQVRARSVQTGGITTNFSDYTFFGIGQDADVPLNSDLSRDGRVNLTDFSILLFWWNSNGGDSDPPADINQSGRVDLTDFSILLFNWTG